MKIEGLSNLPAKDQNRLGELADKLEELENEVQKVGKAYYEYYVKVQDLKKKYVKDPTVGADLLESIKQEAALFDKKSALDKKISSIHKRKNALIRKYAEDGTIKLNRGKRFEPETSFTEGRVEVEGIVGWSRVSSKKEAWYNAFTGNHYVRRNRGGFTIRFIKGTWPVELSFWEKEDGTFGVDTDGTSLKTNRACLEALIKLLEKEYEIE